MKNGKSNVGFSYIHNMAKFEALHWNFLSSTNPEIGRSVLVGEGERERSSYYLLLIAALPM